MDKTQIAEFWSQHPLGSYEITHEPTSYEYFKRLNDIRRGSSKFVMDFYRFPEARHKKVLDVGCGPGWVTYNYAVNGARIYSSDLTSVAIELARTFLAKDKLSACFFVSDAEHIPCRSDYFDIVSCDGVLHHTPGTQQGIREIYRVLKPRGRAVISLYYRNIFLRRPFFIFLKIALRIMNVRLHGIKKIPLTLTVEEFAKLYDGMGNPLGKLYPKRQCRKMLSGAGFRIVRSKVYYFPRRFFPFQERLPLFLYKFLDNKIGTMIFYEVEK